MITEEEDFFDELLGNEETVGTDGDEETVGTVEE